MIQFAIVDIETTGGSADSNGITEIAIRIWDGVSIIDQFTSLVNPQIPIPLAIQALTCITNEMVRDAPVFSEIAQTVFDYLKDRVFVAHNVHFDYSFIHYALIQCGFEFRSQRLCTVRLSRKILPGIPSYSLGRLTEYLGIKHTSRHRAGGDADATVLLFHHLQKSDIQGFIPKSLKQESSLGKFPPKLPMEDILALPLLPGVYFFKNEKGKVIYVGKAVNIKKRIISHFSGNSIRKQKQEFIQKVASIHTETFSTELMALIYESHEIKRLWPELNRAQKRREDTYGLFEYMDQQGFIRLGIDKIKPSFPSIYTFGQFLQGIEMLRFLCMEFNLDPLLCSLAKKKWTDGECLPSGLEYQAQIHMHNPVENQEEGVESYNERVKHAIDFLKKDRSFAILEEGFKEDEKSCLLLLRGEWLGMGYISSHLAGGEVLKQIKRLKPLKMNGFIRQTLYGYAVKYPDKVSIIPENDLVEFESKRKMKPEPGQALSNQKEDPEQNPIHANSDLFL